MWPFKNFLRRWREPPGYELEYEDQTRISSSIRGDLVPLGIEVIVYNGIPFVRTGERDDQDHFEIYREGYKTFTYIGWD